MKQLAQSRIKKRVVKMKASAKTKNHTRTVAIMNKEGPAQTLTFKPPPEADEEEVSLDWYDEETRSKDQKLIEMWLGKTKYRIIEGPPES